MGYTHYWSSKRKVNEIYYQAALKDLEKIVKANFKILADGAGTKGTSPEFEKGICFNGVEDDSHETFLLPDKASSLENFDFCKTQCKPYDKVVVACLTVLHNYCPEIEISSDGDLCDLEEGLHLARKILKNKNLVNIYDTPPSNAEKFITQDQDVESFKDILKKE